MEPQQWGQFFTRFRKTDGELTSGVLFNKEEFEEHFGSDAYRAVSNLRHHTGNDTTQDNPQGWEQLQKARDYLTEIGIDPDGLLQGRDYAVIEDL